MSYNPAIIISKITLGMIISSINKLGTSIKRHITIGNFKTIFQ
jgi:hypothetical protein